MTEMLESTGLFATAAAALAASECEVKLRCTHALVQAFRQGVATRCPTTPLPAERVGRPARPRLVHPRHMPRRGIGSTQGRIRMMHAIAHIEFNAINLALDAVQRFQDMPDDYYADWLRVADEEARHFAMVRDWLRAHGSDYGAFDAHNGLWEMAEKTAGDALERMAMAPRVLEARGLDVTPGIIEKLKQAGQDELVTILQVIYDEEIGHVRIGDRWFRYLCAERGMDAESAFQGLLKKHFPGGLHGPFNLEARRLAGFSESELAEMADGKG